MEGKRPLSKCSACCTYYVVPFGAAHCCCWWWVGWFVVVVVGGWLVGWLVGWLDGWLLLVGGLVGGLVVVVGGLVVVVWWLWLVVWWLLLLAAASVALPSRRPSQRDPASSVHISPRFIPHSWVPFALRHSHSQQKKKDENIADIYVFNRVTSLRVYVFRVYVIVGTVHLCHYGNVLVIQVRHRQDFAFDR